MKKHYIGFVEEHFFREKIKDADEGFIKQPQHSARHMSDEWTMNPEQKPDTSLDIEFLKKEVGQRFPFYDMKFNADTAIFFCRIDEFSREDAFDSLRVSLSEKGYIPMLRYEKGEHIIYVLKKPKIKKKPVWINIVLFIATVFSTTLAGSLQWVGIDNVDWMKIFSPFYLWDGFIFFSVPLMLILGVHEMGHYYASKKHHVDASLPYFIPLPPPFILGTFGAIISTREPIPNRKTLLDIGVSGPICGFLVAIPIVFLGFFLMQQHPIIPSTADSLTLASLVMPSLLIQGIQSFFAVSQNAVIHPTLFAGLVGIFLTAVNLLPIGQLDGGHVARAFLKEKHKYASWAVIGVLLILGMLYTGWLMLAFIVLFLIGTQHQPPLNESDALDSKRKFLGVIILIVFIVSFAPIPF
ncbi:MAG: site-2 protease family protein [Euryarchaeota archaeon]|nr:site-2 protease family protein [Euryarchaeota archaeon]